MEKLKILYIEDDKATREDLVKLLNHETLAIDDTRKYIIEMVSVDMLDDTVEQIHKFRPDVVILDIKKDKGSSDEGLAILKKIQNQLFVPIIFYSGNISAVKGLESQIVGSATKGDGGVDELKAEITRITKSGLAFIKRRIHGCLEAEFINYFWGIIHEERDKFHKDSNDFSLGYLLLRKFALSLSKEKIYGILGDTLTEDKVHPMEFYVYPTDKSREYENGEVLKKGDEIYVILTPSCDFIETIKRSRKAQKVLLAKPHKLIENDVYEKYLGDKVKYTQKLTNLIESRLGDRYFFLPKTPFIENMVIDFQVKEMCDYADLKNFSRIAKLDDPYAQSMTSSFIRYYNRIGSPDLDSNLILIGLDKKKLS